MLTIPPPPTKKNSILKCDKNFVKFSGFFSHLRRMMIIQSHPYTCEQGSNPKPLPLLKFLAYLSIRTITEQTIGVVIIRFEDSA